MPVSSLFPSVASSAAPLCCSVASRVWCYLLSVCVGFTCEVSLPQEAKMMTLRKGSMVWAEDRSLAWVAAEVTDFVGKQVQVLTSSGKKVTNRVLSA